MQQLTDDDTRILDFERKWETVTSAGRKEAAIRDEFDCSSTIYYARLNTLLDEPAAWAYDPLMVKRLRRLREARRALRSAGRVG